MAKPYHLWVVKQVSARDQEIYRQVAVENKTQGQVAALHRLSQPRVSHIVKRVARWLSQTAPIDLNEIPRPQRLYLVARTYKMKLDYYEQRALQAFNHSETEDYSVKLPLVDGKVSSDGDVTRKKPRPDVKLLLAAQRFSQMQVEFEGFEANGEVQTDNRGRLYEQPELPNEVEQRKLIEYGKRLEAELAAADLAAQARLAEVGARTSSGEASPVRSVFPASLHCAVRTGCATPPELGAEQRWGEAGSSPERNAWESTSAAQAETSVPENKEGPASPALEATHPDGSLLKTTTEVETNRENKDESSIHNTLSSGIQQGNERLTYSRVPDDATRKRLDQPADPREERDGEMIRYYPVAPEGYYRRKDRCYPIPGYRHIQKSTGIRHRPNFLPAAYYYDDFLDEWKPVLCREHLVAKTW